MKPIIYQLLPRLFGNTNGHCAPSGTIEQNGCGKLADITPNVLTSLRHMGVTHVWYTGVIRHATKTDYSNHGIPGSNVHVVKGQAGSPYAIADYYDINPDLAIDVDKRQEEFDALVARTHAAGLKVIIDFVPNHVARQYRSIAKPAGVTDLGEGDDNRSFFDRDNNFYYLPGQVFSPTMGCGDYVERPSRATGNDCFSATPGPNDWYETVKLNYGVDPRSGEHHFNPIPDTWHKMLHIMLYWAGRGVDALRCDMAHMVPVEFWQWAIGQVKSRYPGLRFIAEIYDVGLYADYLGRGGFDYLYDKVTLYDTLLKILLCQHSTQAITHCWQTVNPWLGHMLHFLENHDEPRLASRHLCGNSNQARPALVVSAMLDTGPMMIYQGQELGEKGDDIEGFSGADGRTTIFDYWSMDSVRRWLARSDLEKTHRTRDYYKRVLCLCNQEPAIAQGQLFDLMYVNPHIDRQYAFLRHHEGCLLLIVANFSPQATEVPLLLPQHAFDHLRFCPGEYSGSELLHRRRRNLTIAPDRPCVIAVPGNDAVVWKINVDSEN